MHGQGFCIYYILPLQISSKFQIIQTKKDFKKLEDTIYSSDNGEQHFGAHI